MYPMSSPTSSVPLPHPSPHDSARDDSARGRRLLAAIVLGVALAAVPACGTDERPSPDTGSATSASAGPQATGAGVVAAADTAIPPGPLGESILRGRAIMLATRESLPDNVGNGLRCTTCHLDEGRRENAMPWTGVYGRFPQYRSRTGTVIRLEDRVNDCLLRSMNGSPLPVESDAMRDIVSYMAHLSRGIPAGEPVRGQGVARLEPLAPDTARGRAVYESRCVSCHGADGSGTAVATPLWGPGSYNIGAGMARLNTAAAFIKHNMPFGSADLTTRQAFDVAAYVNSHPRPDFAGKENDWPHGDPPPDVAYPTRAGRSGGAHR